PVAHAAEPVRSLARRAASRGTAIPRGRASFICAGRTADQQIAVPVLEPDGQDVRVAVQADKAELADDRATEDIGRAWVQSAAILGVDRGYPVRSLRSKVLAMAVQAKVRLLTDHDLPYTDLVPGLELSRAITHAGTTQLGGGYMRFSADAEFPDWTL